MAVDKEKQVIVGIDLGGTGIKIGIVSRTYEILAQTSIQTNAGRPWQQVMEDMGKTARKLLEEFGGEVPRTLEELTSLPGVGRKTANVIRGNVYHDPSVVVDTHVKRISKRLGLTQEDDPVKVEYDLMKALPKDHWILYNIHIITLGRTICTARSPKCGECFLSDLCNSEDKKE